MSKKDDEHQKNERKKQVLRIIEEWMREEESRAQWPKEDGDTYKKCT
ncbi:hypothetical protein [Paenibacillus selenitireducens]|nr:hypothetical protein [Paenibacillus selenitireducens]